MYCQLDFPPIDLVGQTTLRQTAAVLEQCDLYVGNDTGPLHIAAAAGTPVVVVMSHPLGGDPTWRYSPDRFGPRGVPSRIIRPEPVPPCTTYCRSGIAHCILNVPIDQVTRAIHDLWPEMEDHAKFRGVPRSPQRFPDNMGLPVI
jgi:heptosyltransferase-2